MHIGTQPFGPLDILVRPPVLIPRPETEDWTLKLAKTFEPMSARKPIRLLDLCTGTGCIPLLLCHLWPQGVVHALGVDIAAEAIQLAQDNAKHCGISLASDELHLQEGLDRNLNTFSVQKGDILQPRFHQQLRWQPVDILTSNPPYIPAHEYASLPASVKDYEDKRALLGDLERSPSDGRGLTFYRAIAELVRSDGFIKPGGLIALEVGHDQSEEVQNLMMTQAGVRGSEIWRDPWGIPRTVISWK